MQPQVSSLQGHGRLSETPCGVTRQEFDLASISYTGFAF